MLFKSTSVKALWGSGVTPWINERVALRRDGRQARRVKWVIAIALSCAASCGDKEAPRPPPPLTGLAVIDAGLAPRTPLRYRAPKGTRTAQVVTADIAMGDGAQKLPWPTVTTKSVVTAEDVLADGTIKVRYAVTATSAEDRPNAVLTAEQMNQPLQLLVGTSITGTLSPSGVLGSLAVDTGGKTIPPALEAQVTALSRNFEHSVMPLPAEPIGVGALWTFKQAVDQNGMKVSAATTIKVTAMTETTLTIALTSELTGPDQQVEVSGSKVSVSKVHGTMRGTGVIDLLRLAFTGELVADLAMDMAMGSDRDHTTMTSSLRLALEPAAQGAQNAP